MVPIAIARAILWWIQAGVGDAGSGLFVSTKWTSISAELREILLRVDERRLDLERLLKLIDGPLDLPQRRERNAQVVVRLGRVRHQLKRRAELFGRFREPSGLQKDAAQIVLGFSVTRIEPHRAAKMINRFRPHAPRRERAA